MHQTVRGVLGDIGKAPNQDRVWYGHANSEAYNNVCSWAIRAELVFTVYEESQLSKGGLGLLEPGKHSILYVLRLEHSHIHSCDVIESYNMSVPSCRQP